MTKHLYIKTYGCQMNVYDSARMAELVEPLGYAPSDTPDGADLVILNTCHIREKAAEKVFAELGGIRRLLADVAGVEDDQIGAVRGVRWGIAERLDQLGHARRIVDIHLAAVGLDVEVLRHQPAAAAGMSAGVAWFGAGRGAAAACSPPRPASRRPTPPLTRS